MSENRKQILEMLAAGKITAAEAENLIKALGESETVGAENGKTKTRPKYLRVVVESDEHHHGHGPTKVNIRVPFQLLRAGVKLASLIPAQAREHINKALHENGLDIDVAQLKPEHLEALIENINDLTVDVDETNNKVRIFCE